MIEPIKTFCELVAVIVGIVFMSGWWVVLARDYLGIKNKEDKE